MGKGGHAEGGEGSARDMRVGARRGGGGAWRVHSLQDTSLEGGLIKGFFGSVAIHSVVGDAHVFSGYSVFSSVCEMDIGNQMLWNIL
jgi:hypothetical protein